MLNPYQTIEAEILSVKQQTAETKSFDFRLKNGKPLDYIPGQFYVFSLPGWGESVFVPAEKIGQKNLYDIAIHKVGRVTEEFHRLKKGDTFGIRGPYGNGFDLTKFKGKNILLVAGGLGLIPLRSFIHYYINHKQLETDKRKIQLFYGARSYEDLIFKSEFPAWKKHLSLEITLGKPHPDTAKGWRSHAGLITTLFKKVEAIKEGVAILCGPPIMFKFVVPQVQRLGFKDEDIYLSLERRMHCAGLGTCQHCAIGPLYVCKDGPVFTQAQLNGLPQYPI